MKKDINFETVERLTQEIHDTRSHEVALALDFDGVCKLFTAHKHQIMFTCLFLHVYEFQRVPYDDFRKAYTYINFRSPDYAGKERFRCVEALSRHLVELGYDCALPGVSAAVTELKAKGQKLAANNFQAYAESDDVARMLAWSDEVNRRVGELREIRLTAGIQEHILTPFRNEADFYVASTASEQALRESLERDGVDYVRRYFGQETATKAEALLTLARSGYTAVFMFGDSVEDERAWRAARSEAPDTVPVVFVPVIPDDERESFAAGEKMVRALMAGRRKDAEAISAERTTAFQGRQVGVAATYPMDIRSAT